MISEEQERSAAAFTADSGAGCLISATTPSPPQSFDNRWAPVRAFARHSGTEDDDGGGQVSVDSELRAQKSSLLARAARPTTTSDHLKFTCFAKINHLIKKATALTDQLLLLPNNIKRLNGTSNRAYRDSQQLFAHPTTTTTITTFLKTTTRSSKVIIDSMNKKKNRISPMNANLTTMKKPNLISGEWTAAKRQVAVPSLLLCSIGIVCFFLCGPLQQVIQCERFSAHHHRPSLAPTNTDNLERSQFNDLVAIGAISLIEPSQLNISANQQHAADTAAAAVPIAFKEDRDRLVEEILSNQPRSNADPQRSNKLDYIVEFMRTNKLTKFCDLLTNQEPEIKALNKRLNSLNHFTLFVPTNEALILMPSGQFEKIKASQAETKHFLLAHLTGELVVPRLSGSTATIRQTIVPAASTNQVQSLAGNLLHVSTVPIQTSSFKQQQQQQRLAEANRTVPQLAPLADEQQPAPVRSLKLELIVNGANVISGHSYALQEPNNSSVTYAIVHLIDRALYPFPTQTLMDKIRLLAPKMAKYIELAADNQLNQLLESSSQHLTTLFLPNEDAFRATPSKLLNHLDSNRTFLNEFLRAHLVEGLYYSNQLASGSASNNLGSNQAPLVESERNQQTPNRLNALSGALLEFESRTLQSRTLVLVNSIPILESDLMALNGVVHLITRPIFERHLLEECRCGGNEPLAANVNTRQSENLTESAIYERLWPSRADPSSSKHDGLLDSNNNLISGPSRRANLSNWFQSAKNELPISGSNELEREESQHRQSAMMSDQQVRSRSLRSGLVTRNNRDFYRPSAAPANLLIGPNQQQHPAANLNLNSKRQDVPSSNGQIFIDKSELNRMLANNMSGSRVAIINEKSKLIQDESPLLTTEANLKRAPSSVAPSSGSRWESTLPGNMKDPAKLFEDRYKVVLNATSRQRLREQQRDGPTATATTNNQFVYDRPLLNSISSTSAPTGQQQSSPATTEPFTSSRRPYIEAVVINSTSPSSNSSGWAANVDQLALAASRQQRVLKFQPEDARDPLAGERIHNSSSTSQSERISPMQPVYDVFNSASTNNSYRASLINKQQASIGKTVPPNNFGCAFYDTDCKRMVGRLVHLPAHHRHGSSSSRSKSPALLQASASNQTMQASQSEQHLDSTFGEATENPNVVSNVWPHTQPSFQQQAPPTSIPRQRISPAGTNSFVRPNPPRISPLNQPLPPWSDEEHRAGQSNWRAQDGDIARITSSKQLQSTSSINNIKLNSFSNFPAGNDERFTGNPSRDISPIAKTSSGTLTRPNMNSNSQSRPLPAAQILLVPVKVVQESFIAPANNQSFGFTRNPTSSSPLNTVFFNNQQFHTPTPYSVSLITTHLPPMFDQNPSLGRLTNFTAFERQPAADGLEEQALKANAKNLRVKQATGELVAQLPRAPSAHRKQRLQQIQIDNNGALGANFEFNPANGVKQERKIVRIQPLPAGAANPSDFFTGLGGDISITSARLTSIPVAGKVGSSNFTLAGGLATQASQPAPNVSANFVRSVSETEQQAAANSDQSTDFFQNRTIAEIMDDSGLRIDGQQVTFGRLKECLADAELLNLVTQTGNSLTIFMPTDTAFQRLVQQQVILQQRDRQQASPQTLAARLVDPSRRYLIPLMVRRVASTRLDELGRRFELSSSPNGLLANLDLNSEFNGGAAAALSAAGDRLTLDCSSKQVRQILLDHLSSRLVTPKQLQTDMGISSLGGHQLILSSVPSKKIVVVDGQPVIAATRAKNGMVYVVNKFLNLTQQVPNVMDLIETQPNLTTFLSYLSFSSLATRLRRESGPLTILAPTNEAFEQLSSSARQLVNSDPSALMDILRGHVVEGAQFGKLISMRNRLKTLNADQIIEAKVIKPNLYLLDNQMTSMRLVGTTGNGVVNAIDRLIVPAWLKVSMGAKPQISEPNRFDGSTNSNTIVNGAISGSGGNNLTPAFGASEPDIPPSRAGGGRTFGGNNNLPLIGNRPLKFEQPADRLTTPNNSGSSSFSFAKNENQFVGNTLNNSLLEANQPWSASADNSITSSTPAISRSPFLRVAANLTGTGDVLLPRLPSSPTNVTKNMQLIEKLANLMQAKKFVKYLFRSRASELLKSDMNYVILVPTDQAIDKLPKQIIEMLDRDSERLADLINYHILDTTFEYINTIPDGQTLNTLNEKDILFNWHRNNTILTASGAVVMGGIQEENIALLIVDRVLYPTPGDILNIISKSPILSNFTSLVRNAGLEQQLSLVGPFTLFAPSDFAFNQLDKGDLEFLQRNRDTARRFLLRHISQPAIFTSSIALSNSSQSTQVAGSRSVSAQVPTMIISNSLGEDLTLRQRNDYFSVNEVNFSYADVAATNGVVHVIDGLL